MTNYLFSQTSHKINHNYKWIKDLLNKKIVLQIVVFIRQNVTMFDYSSFTSLHFIPYLNKNEIELLIIITLSPNVWCYKGG